MVSLVKYDSARFALQQAVEIDEVKDIRDKAEAIAAYARQAKDTDMIRWVTEIKVRAERKAGQMLAEMPKATGTLRSGKSPRSHDGTTVKLADLGISKNESSRWQKLASIADEKFEHAVAAAKEVAGEVTTAAMLRIEKASRQQESEKKLSTGEIDESFDPAEHELQEAHETINHLSEENQKLRDSLVAGQLPDDEIVSAEQTMIDLRKQIKAMEAELDAVKSSRDIYQRENEQLKKQCKIYENKLKKLAGGKNA